MLSSEGYVESTIVIVAGGEADGGCRPKGSRCFGSVFAKLQSLGTPLDCRLVLE